MALSSVGRSSRNACLSSGNVRADKFSLDRDKHLVFFYGNVQMTLYPNAMKKSGPAKAGAAKKGPKTP